MIFEKTSSTLRLALGATALTLIGSAASADQVILDDLIVDGSICAGLDCVNGESFGFDTLRLKENNLRIKAQDTSTSASFPTNDWQITFNESSNGGQNKFSIDDIDGGRTPFTIEAGAPSHSLYVDDGGRIGLGTSTPVVEVHVVDGDTPTVRLEQDGSSGFTPQTWDMAGNETNWFVRDATNGSRLPLRIRPSAPSNSIFVDTDGDVGMGTSSPQEALHISRSASGVNTDIRLESTNLSAPSGSGVWELAVRGTDGEFAINDNGSAGAEFIFRGPNAAAGTRPGLTLTGAVVSTGGFFSADTTIDPPDYVFADDYELMPLGEVEAFIVANRHLPRVPSAAEIKKDGLNLTQMQMALLEKVEELTLHTLAQQKTIDMLQARLETLAD